MYLHNHQEHDQHVPHGNKYPKILQTLQEVSYFITYESTNKYKNNFFCTVTCKADTGGIINKKTSQSNGNRPLADSVGL